MPDRKILIAIPCYSGSPSYATQVACANATREAAANGWEVAQMVRSRDSILVRARDVLVSHFYASDCSDMLFLDSDIAFDPGVFTKIMSHDAGLDGTPVEMVGGVYCGRGDPPEYVCAPLPGGIDIQYPAGDKVRNFGIAKVRGVGTGFLRITRPGARRMIEALPPDHWYLDEHTAPGLKIWHLFDFTFDAAQDPGMRLRSEDYVLSDRFRAAGGTVWADCELPLHHLGEKIYSGHFGDFLRAGGGQRAPEKPAVGLSLVDAVKGMIGEEAAA